MKRSFGTVETLGKILVVQTSDLGIGLQHFRGVRQGVSRSVENNGIHQRQEIFRGFEVRRQIVLVTESKIARLERRCWRCSH